MKIVTLTVLSTLLALAGCATVPPPPPAGLAIDRTLSARGQSDRIKYIIVHYTVSDLPRSIKILTTQDVSAHYLVTDADPVARDILEQAGRELARIALALVRRYGPRPIALAGRAATLHPLIALTMRAALPEALLLTQRATKAHHAAARIALNSLN